MKKILMIMTAVMAMTSLAQASGANCNARNKSDRHEVTATKPIKGTNVSQYTRPETQTTR